MKLQKILFWGIMMFMLCLPHYAYSIAAFPGAQGFGANSVGGRGGTVIKVTNLNDSGAGSFREAVTASGARIVVFAVSGIINLTSDLRITNPYITIAGQTSPGGILITGNRVIINTHDVIIQHIRFRLGTHGAASPADLESFDTLSIYGNAVASWYPNQGYNIIIDHCSISWGVDENLTIGLGAYNVTVQWSVVSEGLSNAGHPKGEHSKGLMVSTKYTTSPMSVSLHHNFIAHNVERSPLICCGEGSVITDVVNNVIYNFKGGLSMQSYGNSSGNEKVNWIHNYVKQGPNSNSYAYEAIHTATSGVSPTPIIYVEGNVGSRRLNQSDGQWYVGENWLDKLLNEGYRSATAWSAPSVKTATMSLDVANCILSGVGATAPVRDSVDTKVIADFTKGTGAYKDNVSYPGDFPTFSTPSPATDNDSDGMADSWETSQGLDTTINDSRLDKDKDGYTNIEEYLHYLSTKSYTYDTKCMPDTNANPPAPPQALKIN